MYWGLLWVEQACSPWRARSRSRCSPCCSSAAARPRRAASLAHDPSTRASGRPRCSRSAAPSGRDRDLRDELALGIGLLVTAGRIGAGWPADAVRVAAALLFCTAVGALHELRTRRPDEGCGCFGDLSGTPVNWRTITRAALLGAAALASIGAPPLHMPGSPGQAAGARADRRRARALLAALSPEIGQVMVRLGHAEPCELRRVPVARTLAALRPALPGGATAPT
jgi:hypothetical protein